MARTEVVEEVVDIDRLPVRLTVKDVQKVLRIGKNKAYELVNSPNFPAVRDGRSIFISRDRLKAWLDGGGQMQAQA